jgi:hypothetical protein
MKISLDSNQKSALSSSIGSCSFDRSMTLEEIAELSERCLPVYRRFRSGNTFVPPLTFVVPAHQIVASISRFVE